MTALVLRADAGRLPLPDSSVDLIITSPPYFALRSYTDNGEHYDGQIGSEPSPGQYLDALWACTREWCRVLKPTGSLFVNLGDSYSAYHRNRGESRSLSRVADPSRWAIPRPGLAWRVRAKSLHGLPWAYALGCTGALAELGGADPDLGLILRAEIVWSKPNGLPESVTDRVRRSHEQWFHFTLQPRYFSAVDEIREPHAAHTLRYYPTEGGKQSKRPYATDSGRGDSGGFTTSHPLGKLPGSVWEIPSEPLTVPAHLGVDHFAAFPSAWPKRLILGWSPSGICFACGEGRRPVSKRASRERHNGGQYPITRYSPDNKHGYGATTLGIIPDYRITGYTCQCVEATAPTLPAVVLDPFGGTGTTAAVASALGRIGISVDLSHDYSRLAQWRTTDLATRAKIREERPPVPQTAGQLGFFDEEAI